MVLRDVLDDRFPDPEVKEPEVPGELHEQGPDAVVDASQAMHNEGGYDEREQNTRQQARPVGCDVFQNTGPPGRGLTLCSQGTQVCHLLLSAAQGSRRNEFACGPMTAIAEYGG
jgi:hypothetical protein